MRARLPAAPRKSRPLLSLCDEYQQICSAGDAQFFDTSRAHGVIGIVASQSIEAYIAALCSTSRASWVSSTSGNRPKTPAGPISNFWASFEPGNARASDN